MKKLIYLLVLMMAASGCATTSGVTSIKAADIHRINLGDTFAEVESKIGEPHQVLSKSITRDDKEKVVWLYDSVAPPKQGRILKAPPAEQMKKESIYKMRKENNPPYLIIFINGKVSNIKRYK